MRNPDLQPSSFDARKTALIRAAIIAVIFGTFQNQSGCSYPAEAMDAYTVKDDFETLFGVGDFLKKKGNQLKYYASMGAEQWAKHAPQINPLLDETIKHLQAVQAAADSCLETDIRYSPLMLIDIQNALEDYIRRLNPWNKDVKQLSEAAADMRESRNGFGITNTFAELNGYSPNAIINMHSKFVKARKALVALKESFDKLSQREIEGCSNNRFLDKQLKAKFGSTNCDESYIFCWAMYREGYEDFDPSDVKFTGKESIAVQRKLIESGLLGSGGDDGKFGSGSKKALSRAKKSEVFLDQVRKCRNGNR